MRFDDHLTDAATLAELGRRIELLRLERNLTQDGLATEAGVGRATVQRLERGESVQLGSLLGILRALGLLEGLNALVPEPLPNPVEQLELQRGRRRRASPRREPEPPARPWSWGDDGT